MELTIKTYLEEINSGNIEAIQATKNYIQKAKQENDKYNAYIRFHDEERIFQDLEKVDIKNSKLKWAVISIKDNMLLTGTENTCASKILEWYNAPYTATCIKKLQENWWVIIGKTNMDEFAMGSSNENSWRKPAINKYGNNRTPGWSSGGSVISVSTDLCIWSLGSDTWWSVRQPAAVCNVVWMKPTYGMVSRYWVQSMASSLDQVWVITKTVDDAKLLLECVKWYDENDSQSDRKADKDFEITKGNISDYKIAIPKQFMWEWLDPEIKRLFDIKIDKLKSGWVQIDIIDMPILDNLLSIYYILMPAESSTNLARFDGLRYGQQWSTHDFDTIAEYSNNIRTEWFGEEVKRRILLGTFVLSSENYEWFYLKAQKARIKLQQDFDKLFEKYDFVVSPTSPIFTWKIWEKRSNPLSEYLADIYTVLANLLGCPAISVPMDLVEKDGEEFASGFQVIWKRWGEGDLFEIAKVIEN